jgi:hypothetical protein
VIYDTNEDTGQEFNYALEVIVTPRKDKGLAYYMNATLTAAPMSAVCDSDIFYF